MKLTRKAAPRRIPPLLQRQPLLQSPARPRVPSELSNVSPRQMMRRAWSWLACAAAARAAHLTPAQRDAFFEDGLVVLGTMLDEAAVAAIEV